MTKGKVERKSQHACEIKFEAKV